MTWQWIAGWDRSIGNIIPCKIPLCQEQALSFSRFLQLGQRISVQNWHLFPLGSRVHPQSRHRRASWLIHPKDQWEAAIHPMPFKSQYNKAAAVAILGSLCYLHTPTSKHKYDSGPVQPAPDPKSSGDSAFLTSLADSLAKLQFHLSNDNLALVLNH